MKTLEEVEATISGKQFALPAANLAPGTYEPARKTYTLIRTRKQFTIRTEINGLFEATYHYRRTEMGWQSALRKMHSLDCAGYQEIGQ